MKNAVIVLGVQYSHNELMENLIQSITQDTEGYTSIRPDKSISVWVDDVKYIKNKKKK